MYSFKREAMMSTSLGILVEAAGAEDFAGATMVREGALAGA